jgi:hypothetical protein
MGPRRKPGVIREHPTEQVMRDQEVLRANRELAAYFKGRRTEREARAALKIIKTFVRARERRDAGSRPPLPVAGVVKTRKGAATRQAASARVERPRGKPRRKSQDEASKSLTASIEPQVTQESPHPSDSHERHSE